MADPTAYIFSKFPKNLMKGKFGDLSSADVTVKCLLMTSDADISQEDWETLTDVNDDTNEVSGDGYDAGGAEATTKAVTEATKVTTFDAANVTWTSSTITARYSILYLSTGTAGTSYLIGYADFGEDKSSSSGDFTVAWDDSGILTLTVP